MEEHEFRLLKNGFEIQTRNTHKKAVSLTTDSMDKFTGSAVAGIAAIKTAYQPYHDTYLARNLAVELAEGSYRGRTLNFENLIYGVKDKLRIWEGPIRAVFPEDSPEEVDIFPQKRQPFYNGTYEQRLMAINALGEKLLEYTGANPSLVATQADVEAYYDLAHTAREVQQGKEGNLGTLRTQREQQRKLTMGAFWGIVYGGLLTLFWEDPEQIHDFIDFGLLWETKNEQLFATVTVTGAGLATNVPLTGLDVTPELRLRFKNKSFGENDIVLVYFGTSPTEVPTEPPHGKALNPDDNRKWRMDQLSYGTVNSYLNLFSVSNNPVEVEIWREI